MDMVYVAIRVPAYRCTSADTSARTARDGPPAVSRQQRGGSAAAAQHGIFRPWPGELEPCCMHGLCGRDIRRATPSRGRRGLEQGQLVAKVERPCLVHQSRAAAAQ